MLASLRPAVLVSVIFLIVLGLAYPLAETGIGQAMFSHQVNGSLTAYGSTRVGQSWTGPRWFHGRPDADDPMATGASNLGPRSKTLVQDTRKNIASLRKLGITPTPELVTTSGSGVDPDITPADAYAQVDSIARARGLSPAAVRRLIAAHVQPAEWGFLGASHINVLQLNLALEHLR
jgi:potassium-transporting ATPase KdpC subunit